MDQIVAAIGAKYNYIIYITLMMIGLYAIIVKSNLVKKIIGMNIFQTSIILFYVSIAYKSGKTIPVVPYNTHDIVQASDYINPLPHVLMLTAIVVSVATLGVALSLVMKIYRQYGTLEEKEINTNLRSEEVKS